MRNELCLTLTDNGSLRPDATISLRELAGRLGERVADEVHPVSLLHSNKIAPSELGGQPAETLEPFMLRQRESGVSRFLITPLFFGPSAAIAEYLPRRIADLRKEQNWPELEARIAPWLVDRHAAKDLRMAEILADLARRRMDSQGLARPAVGLVDHGTPRLEVTLARNFLADQLRRVLGDRVSAVAPCSMERRDSAAYDFNEPLLARLLGSDGFREDVVVSMLFLQPGRHAGEGGDVATICAEAESRIPGLRTHMTGLVGAHPALLDILAERVEQGRASAPL